MSTHALAILPIAHYLKHYGPPADRLVAEHAIPEGEIEELTLAVRAYQIRSYLLLVQTYFGLEKRLDVERLQFEVLDSMGDTTDRLRSAISRIDDALNRIGEQDNGLEKTVAEALAPAGRGHRRTAPAAENRLHGDATAAFDAVGVLTDLLVDGKRKVIEACTPLFDDLLGRNRDG